MRDAVPVKFAAKILEKYSAQTSGAFLQQPATAKEGSYQSQSGAIFGIMKTMQEEFETNLKTSKEEEAKAASDFEAMSAAKADQIATGKTKLDEMEEEHATNIKAKSDAKEDLELTRNQRTEDVEFLRNLKLTCQDLDRQWAERVKMRGEETKAVAETIAIVTSDDAKELMGKTVTLLQVAASGKSESEMHAMRMRVSAKLNKAAQQPIF